ncbi:hypothetical protein BDV12DRAFT_175134 [Aspergillus spectabilis]
MESLEALKLYKVHIWYLHSPDRTDPLEDTQSWEVATIGEICDYNGWIKPSVCQGIS